MSRRLCLLWLMLALLPLRGWAAASMGVPAVTVPMSVAAEHAGDAAHHSPSLMPCHDNMAGPGQGDETAPTQQACTSCDLCHGVATLHTAPDETGASPPDPMPRPAAARDTGRNAVGGLERPPRPLPA